MNIHPIVVHFPIALLTVYSLLELLRFKRIRTLPFLTSMKALLLAVGGIGALAASATGEMAAEVSTLPLVRTVVYTHEQWATITIAIYGILAAAYVLTVVYEHLPASIRERVRPLKITEYMLQACRAILWGPLVTTLALAGLVAVTITGALGGAMVHGPDTDPVVGFVYKLLIK